MVVSGQSRSDKVIVMEAFAVMNYIGVKSDWTRVSLLDGDVIVRLDDGEEHCVATGIDWRDNVALVEQLDRGDWTFRPSLVYLGWHAIRKEEVPF